MNMIAHELRVKFKAVNFMYCCCYGTQFHKIWNKCSFNILLMVSMGARETENSFYHQLSLCLSVNLGNLTVLFFSLYL